MDPAGVFSRGPDVIPLNRDIKRPIIDIMEICQRSLLEGITKSDFGPGSRVQQPSEQEVKPMSPKELKQYNFPPVPWK